MNIQFPFSVRQADRVADAVAKEIYFLTGGEEPRVKIDLLSISGTPDSPVFRYEGGIYVRPHLINLSQFEPDYGERIPEEWVVTGVTVRFHPHLGYLGIPKVEEEWGVERLLDLERRRPWYKPRVVDKASIQGFVGVYLHELSLSGFTLVDPVYENWDGGRKLVSVPYHRFVEGDLERVKAEAETRLEQLIAARREVFLRGGQ